MAKTNFSELNATLHLKNGIAENHDLSVSADVLKLSGGGMLNLAAGTLDYKMQASANPKVPELAGLIGLTLPITLSGPIQNPVYKADTANLKEQIIARQKAEAQAKIDRAAAAQKAREEKIAAQKAAALAEKKKAELAAKKKARSAPRKTTKVSKP
ncbi:AsmA-like C-terminal region-containing protein [Deefgea sp. CFH1-16]|uniref:AsmA-like C-terminal region-containing protein n=1 Tax=Deefgea sp. CFH1-16 TaxID=2675457 RepID=UPI0015F5BEDB|nr:AsmA-like C-terminal region-containing protein [Deefgea sp. CFH1-16]